MSFWFSNEPQIMASRSMDAVPGLGRPPTSTLMVPLPVPGATPVLGTLLQPQPLASPENPLPAHASAVSSILAIATDVPSLVPVSFPAPPPPPPSPPPPSLSLSSFTGLLGKLAAGYAAIRQPFLVESRTPAWLASLSATVSDVVGPYRDVLLSVCLAVQQSPFAGLVLPQSLTRSRTLTVKDLLMPILGDCPSYPGKPMIHLALQTFRLRAYLRKYPITLDDILRPEFVLVQLESIFASMFSADSSPFPRRLQSFVGAVLSGRDPWPSGLNDPVVTTGTMAPAIRWAMSRMRLQAAVHMGSDNVLRLVSILSRLEPISASLFEADSSPLPRWLQRLTGEVFAGKRHWMSRLNNPADPIKPAIRWAMHILRSQTSIRIELDNIFRPESISAQLEPIFASLLKPDSLLFPPQLRNLLKIPLIFHWFRALVWAALSSISIFARSLLMKLVATMPRQLRQPIEKLLPAPLLSTLFLEAFDDYVSNELPTYLIRLQDMKLVGREEIGEALRPRIAAMTEENLMCQTLCHNLFHPNNQVGYHFTLAIQHYLKFAIFSHRWGPQEPSFRDMMETSPKVSFIFPEGPGFQKLLKFCEEARRYGCTYAWSDTCCINKESSSELQEAIRSMYRWYRNAEVCIAYLGESISTEDFEYEPWFTRGWTLQELLAPRRIRFYGKYWIPINWHGYSCTNDKDNSELMEAIERVTMIPQDDLKGFIPSCSRVYEKMIWASKRRTTRVEDRAYCLLGIFDISMPISYGEGPWAFHRLMEVIFQRCGESGVLAWSGATSPYSLAVPASPACYIKDLREVKGTLRLTESVAFTLTKDGLDIELFVINAKMTSAHRGDKGSRLPWDEPRPSLNLADVRFHDIVLRPEWTLRRNWPKKSVRVNADERDLQRCSAWAVGIVCSRDARGHATLEAGKKYMWMLVGKVRNERGSVWVRVRTQGIPTLRIERNVRSRLETVHIPHRL